MPVSETLEEVSGWLRGCCGEVRESTLEGGRGALLEGARGSGRGAGGVGQVRGCGTGAQEWPSVWGADESRAR